MAGVWNLFAVEFGSRGYCSVLCCFKKLGFNNALITNTCILLWNALFVSSCLETVKIALLLPTVNSMTMQKKQATHHLLCHLLNRPSSQCQMQSRLAL